MEKPFINLDNYSFNRPFDNQTQVLIRLETVAKLFTRKYSGGYNGTSVIEWAGIDCDDF